MPSHLNSNTNYGQVTPNKTFHNITASSIASSTYKNNSSLPAAFLGSTPPGSNSYLNQHYSSNSSSNEAGDDHASSDECAAHGNNFNASDDGAFVPVLPSMASLVPRYNPSSQGMLPWVCYACGHHAFGHRCQGCHKTRDSAALRVFVGQLCREGAAEMVSAMINSLCGRELTAPPLHIEPHTFSKTGFGRGCAWVYVSSPEDVSCIVRALHKRAFVTISEYTGEVGFRSFGAVDEFGYFETSEEEVAGMCYHELSTLTREARELLHYSSPVTAETPTALAHAMKERNNNNNGMQHRYRPQHQQQQQYVSYIPAPCPSATISSPPVLAAHNAPVDAIKTAAVSSDRSSSSSNSGRSTPSRYMWNPYSTSSPRVVLHKKASSAAKQ